MTFGIEMQVGHLRIQRIADCGHLRKRLLTVGTLQQWTVAATRQALQLPGNTDMQMHHESSSGKRYAVLRSQNHTPAGGNQHLLICQKLGQKLRFAATEAGLALAVEDLRNARTRALLQLAVGIDKAQPEWGSQAFANRGFARTHRADEYQIGRFVQQDCRVHCGLHRETIP